MTKKNRQVEKLIKKQHENVEGRKKKERLMWFGVLCIVIIILVMWAWNMWILIYQTVETNAEAPLFSDVTNDFNEILEKDIQELQ